MILEYQIIDIIILKHHIIMTNNLTRFYTALLFIPAIGFFVDSALVSSYAYFLLIIGLIGLSYASYSVNFKSNIVNRIAKSIGCLSTAFLILFLSAEVEEILTKVYKISFAVKMIFMLSNMQGNLDLCTQKSQGKSQVQKSNTEMSDNII